MITHACARVPWAATRSHVLSCLAPSDPRVQASVMRGCLRCPRRPACRMSPLDESFACWPMCVRHTAQTGAAQAEPVPEGFDSGWDASQLATIQYPLKFELAAKFMKEHPSLSTGMSIEDQLMFYGLHQVACRLLCATLLPRPRAPSRGLVSVARRRLLSGRPRLRGRGTISARRCLSLTDSVAATASNVGPVRHTEPASVEPRRTCQVGRLETGLGTRLVRVLCNLPASAHWCTGVWCDVARVVPGVCACAELARALRVTGVACNSWATRARLKPCSCTLGRSKKNAGTGPSGTALPRI